VKASTTFIPKLKSGMNTPLSFPTQWVVGSITTAGVVGVQPRSESSIVTDVPVVGVVGVEQES